MKAGFINQQESINMSEQEDTQKQIATLMAKIAAMETEMAPMRASARNPGIDPKSLAAALARDPVGTLARYGVPKDHVTRVLVADALGDQAPPELRAAVHMGPQVAATNELVAEVQALRQRIETQETGGRRAAVRESIKTLSADKKKYPHLAAAYAADATLFESDVERHGGTAEELASTLETRLAATAKALGAPSPVQAHNTDNGSATGQQATTNQAGSRAPAGDPPYIPKRQSGPSFTDEDQKALRDEIVRKAERGEYENHPFSRVAPA